VHVEALNFGRLLGLLGCSGGEVQALDCVQRDGGVGN